MNPLIVAYVIAAVIVMYVTIKRMRVSAYSEYPDQNHDEPGDWAAYLYFGALAGAFWPIFLPGALLLSWISREAQARIKRNGRPK